MSSDITSNFIIYGGYQDTSDNKYYGFIAILNSNGELLEVLTEYDSGTKFSYFQCLEYDENNNIFGIDKVDNSYRFIMLNNVAIETSTGFSCILRQSYYIPSEANYTIPTSYLQGTSWVKKVNGSATYFMFGSNGSNVLLIEFKINVGSTNEWNYYTGASLEGNAINFSDIILETQNDTTIAYLYYVQRHLIVYRDYFDGSSLTRLNMNSFNMAFVDDIRAINETQCYVGTQENVNDNYLMSIYKVDSGVASVEEQFISEHDMAFRFNLVNGLLFTKLSGTFAQTMPSLQVRYYAIYGVYDGNSYVLSNPISIVWNNTLIDFGCIVQKSFSLYKCYVQLFNDLYAMPIAIYDNQYSGSSYSDYDTLIPLHTELYSNGSIVFARDLYNKQVYQNMSVAIANVPNNYLNNISIQPNNLISTTMTTLVNNTNPITKNIYENLFINFNNKIMVIDNDTSTTYSSTANYINKNINIGTQTNYQNTYIGKIRINYEDNTSIVQSIEWNNFTDYKQTTFSLYIPKSIATIDFISNDETTTYISKNYNLIPGNIYTIKEKIKVN